MLSCRYFEHALTSLTQHPLPPTSLPGTPASKLAARTPKWTVFATDNEGSLRFLYSLTAVMTYLLQRSGFAPGRMADSDNELRRETADGV